MSWNLLGRTERSDLKLTIFDSANLINTENWNAVVDGRNIYLTPGYLVSLERALDKEIDFRYIQFFNDDYKPVAVAVVQILKFVDKGSKYPDLLSDIGNKITDKLIEHLGIKVMVCGNVFATGENGFMYTDDLKPEEAFDNLSTGLYRLRRAEKINGSISMVLLKEFWPKSQGASDVVKEFDFRDFMIDVNMVLKIQENWKSFEDYLASMTSKFRTKAKGVFKKSEPVELKNLEKSDIEKNIERIEELYFAVHEKADFRFGQLNGKAFVNFKEELGEKFVFTGYYSNNQLVGFSSAFVMNDLIDANYVGLDYEVNYEFALYQRMLYEFVKLCIERGVKELRLGRTAEEIKSCIGAEPVNMKLYIRHRNSFSNKLIKPIIESFSPSEFEIRKPFKVPSNN